MEYLKMLKSCRLCKSENIEPAFKRDDACIMKCRSCGIVFLGNELDNDSTERLYSYYGRVSFDDVLSPVTAARYQKLLDHFERYRKNNLLVDVGCGSGHFLSYAAKRGWHARGTETSAEAIRLAEQKGHNIINGDIAGLDLAGERYDVATLFELIEHASDPEGIIRKLSGLIRQGGLIYLTTPNYNNITRRILGNRHSVFNKEHLFYFTPKQLTLFFKKYNFRVKKSRTANISICEIGKILKSSGDLNLPQRQERFRDLAEKTLLFSVVKTFVNFLLNITGTGETIYIFAEKL